MENNKKYENIREMLKSKRFKIMIQKSLTVQKIFFIIFVISVIISEGVIIGKLNNLAFEYENLKRAQEKEIEHNRLVNEEVLKMLYDIRNEQDKQAKAIKLAYEKKKEIQIQESNLAELKNSGIYGSTDLAANSNISVEAMDKIIDYYEQNIRHTEFYGKGYVFIEAAKQSGLNPIYLFAHAACESDYGCSAIARYHNNYFGIGAFDSNPNAAYVMGDNVDEGIISGAIWIRKNYYDQGLTTLEQMNPIYCTDTNWTNMIVQIANTALSII